jgi:hypothetical protein
MSKEFSVEVGGKVEKKVGEESSKTALTLVPALLMPAPVLIFLPP